MHRRHSNLIAVLVAFVALTFFVAEASAMYQPAIGRFVQRDPGARSARAGSAGAASGGGFIPRDQYADGMNLYLYCRSAPVNRNDSFGTLSRWGNTDFVGHYFSGTGRPIDLADVGLWWDFFSAPSVQSKTVEYKRSIYENIEKGAREVSNCKEGIVYDLYHWDSTTTDVTDQIFVISHSAFYRAAHCKVQIDACCGKYIDVYRWQCAMVFGIKDSFSDPLGIGFEVPGGKPYDINATLFEIVPPEPASVDLIQEPLTQIRNWI